VQGKSMLELGCGNGVFTMYLAKLCASVTAVNISSNAIRSTAALAKYNGVASAIELR